MSATALNLYEILGIYRESPSQYSDVTLSEIKQSYHSSLLFHHPDKQKQQQTNVINSDVNQIGGASISNLDSAKTQI